MHQCSSRTNKEYEDNRAAPAPFSSVYVEGSKSAEPPISDEVWARFAFITFPEAMRVLIPFGSVGKTGMSASPPAGNSPRMRSLNSRAVNHTI